MIETLNRTLSTKTLRCIDPVTRLSDKNPMPPPSASDSTRKYVGTVVP
jgi:hypothetical protein